MLAKSHRNSFARVLPLLLAAFLASSAGAQDTHPVTGRTIAGVMGMGGAPWLERSEREMEEAPAIAIKLLDLNKGMNVADVGAGSGYFVQRIAPRVSPGTVYAVDIQAGMLDLLKKRMAESGIANYQTILGADDDTHLPEGQIDLILLVDVYHEFSKPQAMLRSMRKALKPDGRLVLLEYKKEDPDVPIRPEHKMSVKEVKAEIEPEGFRMVKAISDKLPRQHV
ncbi:MAG: methyltransferase domain-containing protein, partial [Bryobacteraceae bacterium]